MGEYLPGEGLRIVFVDSKRMSRGELDIDEWLDRTRAHSSRFLLRAQRKFALGDEEGARLLFNRALKLRPSLMLRGYRDHLNARLCQSLRTYEEVKLSTVSD